MKSTNERGCSDAEQTLGQPPNLIHCFSFITSKYMSPCLVYKCLLRTLGEAEEEEVEGGETGCVTRREGCHRRRGRVRGIGSRSRRGMQEGVADGGR